MAPSTAGPSVWYRAGPSISVSIGTLAKLKRAVSMMSNTHPNQAMRRMVHCRRSNPLPQASIVSIMGTATSGDVHNDPMPRRAVYPGSFDPPTLGHLDIAERAARLFDEIVLAVGINSSKQPFLGAEQRMEALRLTTAHLPNVTIDSFDGLLIDYARETCVDHRARSARHQRLRIRVSNGDGEQAAG